MIQRAGAKPAGLQTWQTLRVEAGTPVQGVDVDENTFAPEVGRTAQAICYTKGCYLGQEPIVMARDRGQINRLLLGLKLAGGPGATGPVIPRRQGSGTSNVERAIAAAGNGIGLAYLRRGNWDAGITVEADTKGSVIPRWSRHCPLPGGKGVGRESRAAPKDQQQMLDRKGGDKNRYAAFLSFLFFIPLFFFLFTRVQRLTSGRSR